MLRIKLSLAFMIILGLFSGCTSDNSENLTSTIIVSTEPARTNVCERASSAQIEYIRAGVEGVQASNFIKTAFAVKSQDFQNAYFVAAMVYGPGIEDGVGPGVWFITGDKNSPGLISSVNGTASSFTDFPDAGQTVAAATMADDGASEVRDCAK